MRVAADPHATGGFRPAAAFPNSRRRVTTMPQEETPFAAAVADLVVANRILAAEGVLDGFGHVSIRDPRDRACYLMSRSLAPALVTAADIVQHDLDNRPIREEGHNLYYERWIHGEI